MAIFDLGNLKLIDGEAIPDALAELARARALLHARLIREAVPAISGALREEKEEHLLDAAQVADRLSTSARWVYRHSRALGVIRISEHTIRFSEAGLRRFLKRQGE